MKFFAGLLILSLSGCHFAPRNEISTANERQKTVDPRIAEVERLNQEVLELQAGGQYREGIELARKQLGLVEEIYGAEHLETAIALSNLVNLLIAQGEIAAAQPLCERALKIRESQLGPEHPAVARSASDLALLMDYAGDYAQARALYERALRIREKALGPEHPDVAESLGNLATLLAGQADYTNARALLERAVEILRKQSEEEPRELAATLSNLAWVLGALGQDPIRQRSLYEEVLELTEEARGPEHPEVARALANLAGLIGSQGDLKEAWQRLERAAAIYEKSLGSEHPDLAFTLRNMAVLLDLQKEHSAARELLERALAIYERALGPENPEVGMTLSILAGVQEDEGKAAEAERSYQRALAIYEKALGPGHPSTAEVVNNLAWFLQKEGDSAAALPLSERVFATYRDLLGLDHPRVATAMLNLAIVKLQVGETSRACELIVDAAGTFDRYIQGMLPALSFAEQRAFLEQQVPFLASLLLSCSPGGTDLSLSYEGVLRFKGLLMEFLRQQKTVFGLAQDSRYKPQAERLREVRSQIAGWYHRAGSISQEDWREKNALLTQEKESLERDLARASGARALEDPLASIGFATFRSILQPGEAFVDLYRYSFYREGRKEGDRYAAVLLNPENGPLVVDLGSAEAVEGAVRAWRWEVLASGSAETSWAGLAARVWKPLAGALPAGTRRVWLSPDGELARIPWHLFPASDPRSRDLLLSQVDSPRELFILRGVRQRGEIREPHLLLAGGLDFDLGSLDPRTVKEFEPLEGSQEEVEALASFAERRHLTATLLMGAAARKDAVLRELPRASYAHLATHGFFTARKEIESRDVESGRNPLVGSGIALAGANVRDDEAEGLLTAEELVGIDLSRCELFVLSACDTGRGEEVTGQGVLGLRSAILAAGARSILMSLWKVPDESTRRLMTVFYGNLWARKMPKAEALLKAQEAIRDDPSGKFKHPIHWAAWVLVGEAW